MKKYDLYLTGTVGWGISAGYVKYVLDNSKGKPVTVAVSSMGGYVDTGLQIYELFKNHGDVTVEFLGMSASSATFMAMGAKTIKMAKNALILIHNSMTWVGEYGSRNKEQIDECIKRLKFQRDQLSTIDDVLAQIYADRNGKPVDEVKAKMKVAAWIKAADAVDFGIVDEVIDAVKVEGATPQNVTNSIINEMGLPPLPSGFNPESGEESPAGILQKAMELLKGLRNSFAVNQDSKMIKIFTCVMALLAIKDGFQPNEQGDIVLTQDEMKKIDDQLKLQDEACKKAKTLIDSLKDEIKKLKDDITSKDDEIKNLKEGPGERKKGGEVVDDQGVNGAAELWKSIENAL
jgi:ATP-dependent protease ClpP protease subunit